tara:strand:- start:255 stop:458 length:204 start_codon:yes stop_codon:yes gene_type:complete
MKVKKLPIYEFKCEKCKIIFEVLQKFDEPDPLCDCGSEVKKIISLNSFRLKGDGWFKDGYSRRKENG